MKNASRRDPRGVNFLMRKRNPDGSRFLLFQIGVGIFLCLRGGNLPVIGERKKGARVIVKGKQHARYIFFLESFGGSLGYAGGKQRGHF